jgi:hypothetical protein
MLRRSLFAALLALLAVPSAAHATRIFAITAESSPRLLSLGASSPSVIVSNVPVTGLAAGEVVGGMDMRPKDGGLYVLTTQGSVARLQRLDAVSGALTAGATLAADPTDLAAPFAGLTVGSGAGVDFNPVPDRLRIVTAGNQSMRVAPDTGSVFTDADLNPGDPAVVGAAYANSWPGVLSTTLYDVDYATDQLLTQNPPNDGTLLPVGVGLGIDLDTPGTVGFDIAAEGNTGYLEGSVGGAVNLYTVNLTTGAATLVGAIGTGTTQLTDIAAAENLVGFSKASFSTRENSVALELTVVRSVPRGTTTVAYSTSDRSASAGADYTATSGTLTFLDGETTATIKVPLTADSAPESAETFAVDLSALTPSLTTTASPLLASATANVEDDDPDRDGDGVIDIADNCPNTANPAQDDTNHDGVGAACDPGEAKTSPPADRTKPKLLLSATGPTRKALRATGLARRLSCDEACTVTITLRAGRTTIGTAKAKLNAAGTVKARVRLTKKGKAAVARARSIALSATATDRSGNRGSDKLSLTLR